MLKPNDFNYKADKVTAYYNDFEDYLLRDIAKFLLNADGVGGKADRELFILQQMGLSQDEITERLAQLTAQSEEAVKEVLQESVMTSFSNDKKVLDKYFSGDYGPLNNPAIRQTMDAEWAKTCGELDNLTRTTLGAYNDTVLKSLNEAEVLCASGAVSYSEAVTNVLDKLAMGGLMLDYPTGAHRSLEAAVRCAVVTSMNQTAAQVTNQYIAEGGIEYVLVSAHTGARISDKGGLYSHAEWQGRAYKIRGSEDGYPNLLEATGYDIDPSTGNGQVVNPNGLHGYNCRHSHQPWDKELDNPWIDDQGNLKVDAEEQKYIQDKQSVIDERIARIQANELYTDKQKERLIAAEEKRRNTCKYEDMQTQRRMESQIRDTKLQIVMKDAELDNVKHDTDLFVQLMGDRRNLEHKLTNRNRVYGQYCADFGLTQQRDRLKVAGYIRKRDTEPKTVKPSNKRIPNKTVTERLLDKGIMVDLSNTPEKFIDAAKESLEHLDKLTNEYNHTVVSYKVDKLNSLTEGGSAYMLNGKTAITIHPNHLKNNKATDSLKLGENQKFGTVYHEFAHALSQSREGINKDFWKEIRAIKKEYQSNHNKPNWFDIKISDYAEKDVDEFLAEAFAQAKLAEKPSPYAQKVLGVVDKYFKKENAPMSMDLQFFAKKHKPHKVPKDNPLWDSLVKGDVKAQLDDEIFHWEHGGYDYLIEITERYEYNILDRKKMKNIHE